MEIICTYPYTLTDTHAYEETPAKQAAHDLAKVLMLHGVLTYAQSYQTI